jgi:hypothetical protein
MKTILIVMGGLLAGLLGLSFVVISSVLVFSYCKKRQSRKKEKNAADYAPIDD